MRTTPNDQATCWHEDLDTDCRPRPRCSMTFRTFDDVCRASAYFVDRAEARRCDT